MLGSFNHDNSLVLNVKIHNNDVGVAVKGKVLTTEGLHSYVKGFIYALALNHDANIYSLRDNTNVFIEFESFQSKRTYIEEIKREFEKIGLEHNSIDGTTNTYLICDLTSVRL